jgi:hypothetical protein
MSGRSAKESLKTLRFELFNERVAMRVQHVDEYFLLAASVSDTQSHADSALELAKHRIRDLEDWEEAQVAEMKLRFADQVYEMRQEWESQILNEMRLHLQNVNFIYASYYTHRDMGIEGLERTSETELSALISSNAEELHLLHKSQYELVTINLERIKRLKQHLSDCVSSLNEDRKKLGDMRSQFIAVQEPLRRLRTEIASHKEKIGQYKLKVLPELTAQKKTQQTVRSEIKALDFELEILIQKKTILEEDIANKQTTADKITLRQDQLKALRKYNDNDEVMSVSSVSTS